MINALPKDARLEEQAPFVARRPETPPVHVITDRLMAPGTGVSIWKRLDTMRMSEMERRAAVDALLLGRDIGKGLQLLGRAVRRWLGAEVAVRHARHASFGHFARVRRTRVPLKRLK